VQVLLQALVVKALESLSIVKILAIGVTGRIVLAKDVDSELIGPPITVLDVES
jgi:hypothetical protein